MRKISISTFIVLFIFCCDSHVAPSLSGSYFTAVQFPNALGTAKIVSNDTRIVIGTSTQVSPSELSITGLDETGSVIWSKKINVAGISDLSLSKMVKVDDNSYLMIAQSGQYPVILKADYDGNILGVSKYANTTDALNISNCVVAKNGSKIYSGTYYESGPQTPYGLIFKEDSTGAIEWSKAFNAEHGIIASLNESETAICVIVNSNTIVILDPDGQIIAANSLTIEEDLVLVDIKSIGGNFYALLYPWESQVYYVLKITSQGAIVKGIESFNPWTYYPDIFVLDSSLIVGSNVSDEIKIAELDTDLTIVNENTFARLVGGSTIVSKISASPAAISSLIGPGYPPDYQNGVNVIRALRSNWTPKCKITEPIKFKIIDLYRNTQPYIGLALTDYAVQRTAPGVQLDVQVVQASAICK